jgi:DNA-directed RNA polymerase beta subunit
MTDAGTLEHEDAHVLGRGIFAGLVLVKVEGAPIAWTARPRALRDEVRRFRRRGEIDREVGLHHAKPRHEFEMRCDADRMLTPRYIYPNLWRLRRLETGRSSLNMRQLVNEQVIEYVDAAEAPDCVTAADDRDARERLAKRPRLRFSHMDLDESFVFGYSAALQPYAHKTPAVRVIFATGMNRNALGVDPEQRSLQKAHQEIWAPQRALCATAAGRVHGGVNQLNGRNLRVAILTMPSNIDDACTANRAWIETHGYTSVTAHLIKSQQRKGSGQRSIPTGGGGSSSSSSASSASSASSGGGGGAAGSSGNGDRFEMPDERTCAGIKMADYSYVDNAQCAPAIDTLFMPNTVAIPKTAPQVQAAASWGGGGGAGGAAGGGAKKSRSGVGGGSGDSGGSSANNKTPLADRLTRRCASEVWRGPPAFVAHTSRSVSSDGLVTMRVELVQVRVPEIGDKLASLHAQKSVIGDVLEPEDMPYDDDGLRPDLVISPFCMPSRMTIGQLEEMVLGRALLLGAEPRTSDSTAFRDTTVDSESTRRLFKRHGYREDGRRVMYDPRTGERMEALVMVGPTFYTKQRHIAQDKINTRSDTGPVDPITGQPVEGKRRNGGQRFGNMEVDAMVAHGASAVLHSRIPRSSDYLASAPVCMRCRTLLSAYEDARTRRLHCTACGHGRNVYYVATHRAFRVLFTETMTTGVKPGLVLATPQASVPQLPKLPRTPASQTAIGSRSVADSRSVAGAAGPQRKRAPENVDRTQRNRSH